jgi:3-oxoacid CoA-transferase B subunit
MSEHAAPQGKPRLTRPQMAQRLAAEFEDGWIVNLGTGMPLMCSDFALPDRTVIFHAENGVIGYGRRAVTEDEASPHLVNAGGGAVVLQPFAAFIHHADSFAIVRKGMLNTSVLGAYEVGADGGLANWKVAGALGGGIGGAMDIAACAQQVFAILEHTQRNGAPRLLPKCTLPLTAPPCVTLVMTDLGLFRAMGDSFEALELAPGWTLDEVAALTGAPLTPAAGMGVVSV